MEDVCSGDIAQATRTYVFFDVKSQVDAREVNRVDRVHQINVVNVWSWSRFSNVHLFIEREWNIESG